MYIICEVLFFPLWSPKNVRHFIKWQIRVLPEKQCLRFHSLPDCQFLYSGKLCIDSVPLCVCVCACVCEGERGDNRYTKRQDEHTDIETSSYCRVHIDKTSSRSWFYFFWAKLTVEVHAKKSSHQIHLELVRGWRRKRRRFCSHRSYMKHLHALQTCVSWNTGDGEESKISNGTKSRNEYTCCQSKWTLPLCYFLSVISSACVCVCVHLPACPPACPPVCPSVHFHGCLPVSLSTCLHVCLSVCLSVRLCLSMTACISVSICLPVCVSTCLSACLPIRLYICVSICLSISMDACLSVCMFASVYLSLHVW